jgi:hypothetical protein
MLQQPVAVHRCPFIAQQKRFRQLLNPVLQTKPQLPLTQVGVELAGACGEQSIPHTPQFFRSVIVSVHLPLQQDCPTGQQTPPHFVGHPASLQTKSQILLTQIGAA